MTMLQTQKNQWYLMWAIIIIFIFFMIEYSARLHIQLELEDKIDKNYYELITVERSIVETTVSKNDIMPSALKGYKTWTKK